MEPNRRRDVPPLHLELVLHLFCQTFTSFPLPPGGPLSSPRADKEVIDQRNAPAGDSVIDSWSAWCVSHGAQGEPAVTHDVKVEGALVTVDARAPLCEQYRAAARRVRKPLERSQATRDARSGSAELGRKESRPTDPDQSRRPRHRSAGSVTFPKREGRSAVRVCAAKGQVRVGMSFQPGRRSRNGRAAAPRHSWGCVGGHPRWASALSDSGAH
eukprot:2481930-Prymnesium_polylepis.1